MDPTQIACTCRPLISRFRTLDHFRGLAAAGVVIFHGFGGLENQGGKVHVSVLPLKWIADLGWIGVHLFFVISGFCIAASLSGAMNRGESMYLFLRDRFLRIYPTYWAACILSLLLNGLSGLIKSENFFNNLPNSWTQVIGNTLLIEPYLGVRTLLLVSWSLSYEIVFYLVAATGASLLRFGVRPYMLAASSLALMAIPFHEKQSGFFFFTNYWYEFIAGVLVYLYVSTHEIWRKCYLIFSLTLIGLASISPMTLNRQMNSTWIACSFAVFLCIIHPFDNLIYRQASLDPIRWIGRVSFSLYLTHTFSGLKFVNLTSRWVYAESFWMLPIQLAAYALCLLFAYCFFIAVESPLDRFRGALKAAQKLPQSIQ